MNKIMKIKKAIVTIFLLCMLSIRTFAAEAEHIIGITNITFFDDMPGTFYVYFGRPTCPNCVVFEGHLNEILQNNRWVVYYFNTAYWKEDSRYDNILRKYKIDGVPTLVKVVDKELVDTFHFNENLNDQEIATELDGFFGEKTSGLFPVTSADNYPIQFSDNLHCFTFILMLIDVLFICFRRKKYLRKI